MVLSVYYVIDFLHHCMLAVHGMNGELFKVLMQRHVKWVKNLMCHEILVLLTRVIFLSRKHIQRAIYMLIMWENFGTKLF